MLYVDIRPILMHSTKTYERRCIGRHSDVNGEMEHKHKMQQVVTESKILKRF